MNPARPPAHDLMRKVVEAASNPRAAEAHFGVVTQLVAGPPAVVMVDVDGATVSQPARYLASYSPTVGDHVLLILVGTDRRNRQQYLALGKLA